MPAAVKPVDNPVLPEHLLELDKHLKGWQRALGLLDWRIVRSPKKTKNQADVTILHPHRLARLRVGDGFGTEPVNSYTLEETALHELLHVLLCELTNQVEYGLEGELLESAEHRVIVALTHALLNPSPRNA